MKIEEAAKAVEGPMTKPKRIRGEEKRQSC